MESLLLSCQARASMHAYVPTDDTCFTIRHMHLHQRKPTEIPQFTTSWKSTETQQLNADWTWIERGLNMSWTRVERELNASWTRVETQRSFNNWSSTELQQLNASSFTCEIFNCRSTGVQLSYLHIVEAQLSFNSWTWAHLHVNFSTKP